MKRPFNQIGGEVFCQWAVGKCRVKLWKGYRLERSNFFEYKLIEDPNSSVEMVAMNKSESPKLVTPLENNSSLVELGECVGGGKKSLLSWVNSYGLIGAQLLGKQPDLMTSLIFGADEETLGPGHFSAWSAEPLVILEDCARLAKAVTDLYRILQDKKKKEIDKAKEIQSLVLVDHLGLKISRHPNLPNEVSFTLGGICLGVHSHPDSKDIRGWIVLGNQALTDIGNMIFSNHVVLGMAAQRRRGVGPFKFYWLVNTLLGALFLKLFSDWKQYYGQCEICHARINKTARTCSATCRQRLSRKRRAEKMAVAT